MLQSPVQTPGATQVGDTSAVIRSAHHLRIEPSEGWVSLKLRELWAYRELLYFLTWRDIKVKYKQTVLGASWAILQPFMTMVVFSLFFGKLAKIPSDGIPYPILSQSIFTPTTATSTAGHPRTSPSPIANTSESSLCLCIRA